MATNDLVSATVLPVRLDHADFAAAVDLSLEVKVEVGTANGVDVLVTLEHDLETLSGHRHLNLEWGLPVVVQVVAVVRQADAVPVAARGTACILVRYMTVWTMVPFGMVAAVIVADAAAFFA